MVDEEPTTRRRRRAVLEAAAFCAVALGAGLAVFGRSAWGGYFTLDPALTWDTYHLATILERLAHHLRSGHFPFYFPEFGGGYPVPAAGMFGLMSPVTAALSFLPADLGWTWSAILHLTFGGLGLFLLVRSSGLGPAAAWTGGLLYALNEFTIGRTLCGHLNLVWPVAWIPWTLLAARRCAAGGRGGTALLALATALGVLAGHLQVWFYAGPLLLLFALLEARRAPGRGAALRRLAVAFAAAAALASPQWLASLEMAAATGPMPPQGFAPEAVSLPLPMLAAKAFPGLLGGDPRTVWPPDLFWHEFAAPAGLFLLFLCLLGLTVRGPGRWFWLATAGAGLLLAAGVRNPVSAFLADLPLFRFSRAPARGLVLTLLGTALLAARGATVFARPGFSWRLATVLAGTAAAGAGAIAVLARHLPAFRPLDPAVVAGAAALAGTALALGAARRFPRAWPAVPATVLLGLLLVAVPAVNTVPSEFYFANPAAGLPLHAARHRTFVAGLPRFPNLERAGWRALREVSPVDVAFLRTLLRRGAPEVAYWFDVRLVVQAALPRVLGGPDPDSRSRVWEVTPACGRALLFAAAEGPVPDEETLDRLAGGRQALYLADHATGAAPGEPSAPPVPVPPAADAGPNRLRFAVTTGADAWLYVSEKAYPQWRATVDGRPAAVRRANVCGLAVAVPAGRHEVELSFAPPSATIAPFVALGAALALALGTALTVRFRTPR